jgi:glycosyltransferase 2 family protein
LKARIFKIINFVFFLALGCLLLYYAFKDVGFTNLVEGLKKTKISWVVLSLFFAGLAFISRAYRWILLIKPLGYKPSVKNTFFALMAGYLANFAFPRLGEVTRCGSLNKTDKIPVDALLGTVIVERISDLIVLFFLVFFVFVIKMQFFGDFLSTNIFEPFLNKFDTFFGLPAFLWIILLILLPSVYMIYRIFREFLQRYVFFQKLSAIKKGVISGMKTIYNMPQKWKFILHTLFIWVMYVLMTYVLFFALDFTSHLKPIDALFLMVIGGIGMSMPVQGGIGAYHWIVSSGLILYGIPREEGLIFATVSHESQAIMTILLGSLSFLFIFLATKKSGPQKPIVQ